MSQKQTESPSVNRLQNISSHITTSTTMSRPPITAHVLDTTSGKPATDITVQLLRLNHSSSASFISDTEASKTSVTSGTTNADGRIASWNDTFEIKDGEIYMMRFHTYDYFKGDTFFPYIEITFKVDLKDGRTHYHIPCLLSPYSYTTYRGS